MIHIHEGVTVNTIQYKCWCTENLDSGMIIWTKVKNKTEMMLQVVMVNTVEKAGELPKLVVLSFPRNQYSTAKLVS